MSTIDKTINKIRDNFEVTGAVTSVSRAYRIGIGTFIQLEHPTELSLDLFNQIQGMAEPYPLLFKLLSESSGEDTTFTK